LGKNPDSGNESKQPAVFTRVSTGLVKSISAFDVLSFTLLAAGPIVLIALGVLTLPSIYAGVNLPLVLIRAIILLGLLVSIIFYPIAKAARKRSGIDLALIYSEIPPE